MAMENYTISVVERREHAEQLHNYTIVNGFFSLCDV